MWPYGIAGLRDSCEEGEERRERKRMGENWAGLKTQETHKWPQEVTHVRNKKALRITVVPCSCPRAESLN